MIRAATHDDMATWLALRLQLWPFAADAEHRQEMAQQLADASRFVALLAFDEAGRAVGFAEAALRHDYVNGCDSSPVAFLEGIYVEPAAQRRGVARALAAAVGRWALARDCSELASDAAIDNHASHDFHRAIGFAETERVVYFRKEIG